jgi:hypothetical protein
MTSGYCHGKSSTGHASKNDGFMPISNSSIAEESDSFTVKGNEERKFGTPHYSSSDSSPMILIDQSKKSKHVV